MSKLVLAIVIGSTRPGRVGPKFAAWFRSRAIEHGGFEVELVDLAALKLPFLDEPGFPRLHQYVHEHTINWGRIVDRCDAFGVGTGGAAAGPRSGCRTGRARSR